MRAERGGARGARVRARGYAASCPTVPLFIGCKPEPTDDNGAPIGLLRQVARVYRRHVAGPVRLRLDIAERQWPNLPGAGAAARRLLEFADLTTLKAAGGKGDLRVGCGRFLQHLDRGGDDRWAVGQHTLAGEEPAHDLAGERQAARALVGRPSVDNTPGG